MKFSTELRDGLVDDPISASAVSQLPDLGETVIDPQLMWAKINVDKGHDAVPASRHTPLINHLLDAAGAAGALWREWLPPAVRRHVIADMAVAFGADRAEGMAEGLVRLAAGLHDIGKASPTFHANSAWHRVVLADRHPRLVIPHSRLLPPHGSPSRSTVYGATSHGVIGDTAISAALEVNLPSDGKTDRPSGRLGPGTAAETVAAVVGGHHGFFSDPELALISAHQFRDWATGGRCGDDGPSGPDRCPHCWWRAIPAAFAERVQAVIGRRLVDYADTALRPASRIALAAIVVLADWIVSNEDLIPLIPLNDNATRELSMTAGEDAVGKLRLPQHWRPAKGRTAADLFSARFPGRTPRAFQIQVADAVRSVPRSCGGMVLIEAPAGSGKTEAALLAAEVLGEANGMAGVAYLLPTRATSNGLFERFADWARRACGADEAVVALSHAKAGSFAKADTERVGFGFQRYTDGDMHIDACCPDDPGEVGTNAWIQRTGRKLLSPFVIGTIDTALSAVVIDKHITLQHLGLMSKVLVIDEVHSSDEHMTSLTCGLLEWAAEYRIPVVALTATASKTLRNRLHRAYSGTEQPGNRTGFPGVTLSWPGSPAMSADLSPEGSPSRTVTLELREDLPDPPSIADEAIRAYRGGARVAVVCNTVRRAQEVYDHLSGVAATLHHSRFIDGDRERSDDWLRAMFGPKSADVTPRIVVATQVLEQSLDVDFDYMISDVSPVDCMLQRAGRVHRHERQRPAGFSDPVVSVVGVTGRGGEVPAFDESVGHSTVYSPRMMLDTSLWLRASGGRRTVSTVDDTQSIMSIVDAAEWFGGGRVPEHVSAGCAKAWSEAAAEEEKRRIRAGETALARSMIDSPAAMRTAWMHDFPKAERTAEFTTARDLSRYATVRHGVWSPLVLVLVKSPVSGQRQLPPWIAEQFEVPADISLTDPDQNDPALSRAVSACLIAIPGWSAAARRDNLLGTRDKFGNPVGGAGRVWELALSWTAGRLVPKQAFVVVLQEDNEFFTGTLGDVDVSYTMELGMSFFPA